MERLALADPKPNPYAFSIIPFPEIIPRRTGGAGIKGSPSSHGHHSLLSKPFVSG